MNASGSTSWNPRFPALSPTYGSVGSPIYSFSSDSDSGLYAPGAGTLAFALNGAQAMTMIAGGSVGIGTGSPGALLELASSSTAGNAVLDALRISHTDSNSAGASGIGTRIVFTAESNSAGVMPETGVIESALNDATNTSKDSYLRFNTLGPNAAAGSNTATERLRISSTAVTVNNASFSSVAETVQTSVNSGTSLTLGTLGASSIYRVTMTGDATITLPADPGVTNGMAQIVVMITQDGTGGRLLSWSPPSGAILWNQGTTPTVCGNPNDVTIYQFMKINGDSNYYGQQVWRECP